MDDMPYTIEPWVPFAERIDLTKKAGPSPRESDIGITPIAPAAADIVFKEHLEAMQLEMARSLCIPPKLLLEIPGDNRDS